MPTNCGTRESLTPLKGGRLLDIGCADGTYTRRLAEGFDRVDAVDVEPERLADFRSTLAESPLKEKIAVAEMSADALAFDDETFDAITAIEVVEHVANLERMFSEVHRVLLPGGRFLLTTPNRWFPFETHGPLIRGRRRKSWSAPGLTWIPPLHRRWSDARVFTLRDLRTLGAAASLQLVGHDYMMPPFDVNRVGQRLRPLTDAVERSRLSFLGMAHIMVFERPTR